MQSVTVELSDDFDVLKIGLCLKRALRSFDAHLSLEPRESGNDPQVTKYPKFRKSSKTNLLNNDKREILE